MHRQLRFVANLSRASFRTMATNDGPVSTEIAKNLAASFQPNHLEVINESHMHNVPKGSETHFKVVVVSKTFEDLPLIKRHRLVNAALAEQLQCGVHALSIVAKTPAQWSDSDAVESSPQCRGGFGK